MADHRHAPLAEPGGRPIVVRTDDDHLGGRNRRMRERMRPGRHAAGDLDIECSFLDPAGPDRLVSPLHHPAQVVRREIQLPETSLQPRQVLHFQPAPALVHPEDLVDRVAEQETPVPDRDLGLLHRHDLSIQTRQNLHRRRSFPGSSADHLDRPRNDRIIGLTAGGQCRPGTPRDGSSEAVLATSGQSSPCRLRRHIDRFDRIFPPRLPRDQRSTTESTEIHGKENPNQLPLSVSFPGATPARRGGVVPWLPVCVFRGYPFVMIFLAGVIHAERHSPRAESTANPGSSGSTLRDRL